ncbi:MAG: hypothetical protein KR126chlam2_00634 [Chlamydiae bacterium]|nr:hypothetical protein [Chlamydiota bacterium]
MIESFRTRLSKQFKIRWDLVINENRSTMLSVLDRKRGFARLSVHRMFLDAPDDVISAIAHYVRGTTRRDKRIQDLLLRGYIQTNLCRFNYAHLLDEKKFVTKGRFYDLQTIYDQLNEEYFQSLNLKITWNGTWGMKKRRRITFGQYLDHLNLVKVHRILDDPFFPDYFVSFIVYHEMVHSIVRGYIDSRGFYRIHGAKFKKIEKEFVDYDRAINWEKKHRKEFLRDGWT